MAMQIAVKVRYLLKYHIFGHHSKGFLKLF
jgi:hypothetical protein